MAIWKKLSRKEINNKVFNALKSNVNYYDQNILGVPASHLDNKVFYQDAPFLADAPYLSTLIHNPNHIGCHTLGLSESFFAGTQQIEQELVRICAEEILKGESGQHDGYVASGGTEANMQAVWIYRNYFMTEHNANINDICILCSADSHYSGSKAANVLNIDIGFVDIDENTREVDENHLAQVIKSKKADGRKYFVVIANMMTTMFGSVDNIDTYVNALKEASCEFKLHVDGAFGGFFYPFANVKSAHNFSNPYVTSVTLDAHKMLQAPYGTGIFLIKKGFINYSNTKEASYVEGEDFTLIGSRSGANAIAVWMILMTYGPHGWYEKITVLLNRTNWLCNQLGDLNIEYYRHKHSNIVTIKAQYIDKAVAKKYGLVPDNHLNPNWLKIVIMDHVTIEKLEPFINDLKTSLK